MHDLSLILKELDSDTAEKVLLLKEELLDTWTKKQLFRTDTEARMSVLDDGKHPTPAAKYWQAVREQAVMFGELVTLSFEIRRNNIEMMRIEKKIIETRDELDLMDLHVDMDECVFKASNMAQVAKDRAREICMWSKIKSELDDGSFDTKDVNTHQAQSLSLRFENRVKSLGPSPTADETFNALSLLRTAQRLTKNNLKLNG